MKGQFLIKCDFSYSCAAADKISTDLRARAVSLRQLSYLLSLQWIKIIKDCRTNTDKPRATHCITANEQVDSDCDKLATEVDNPSCRKSPIFSYRTLPAFNLHHLHLAPSLGVTSFEFCDDFRHQKTRIPGLYRLALFAWSYV